MSLFKRNNHHILLIDFKGLTVFELEDDFLSESRYFSAEDSGYTEFRQYLAESPPALVHIIVDSVAEDFFIETIAHAMAADRQGLMKRKLDQHYRGVEYRNARIIGREATGRRDDKVLFSALTRNQQIDPWVRCLLKEEIPLKSITSPAYIFGDYVKEQGYLTSAHTLLVHWEQSGIRQTYLLNGRTVFSRLTPLPADNAGPVLAQAIIDLCNQSREYLEAVKLLESSQPLDIQVFTPSLDDDAFADYGGTPAFNLIEHHNTNSLLNSNRYAGNAEHVTALLLCIDYAAHKQPPHNAYAPPVARRFYFLNQIRQAIYAACLLIIVAGGLFATPVFQDALTRKSRGERLFAQAEPIDAQYQAQREQFPETPIPSQAMELAVTTFNLIQGQAQPPNQLLIAISRVLSGYPNINLSRVEWHLLAQSEGETITESLLEDSTSVSVMLQGNVTGVVGFQNTNQQLTSFSQALETIQGLRVYPVQLPIENSEYAAVNTTVDDNATASAFILRLQQERNP